MGVGRANMSVVRAFQEVSTDEALFPVFRKYPSVDGSLEIMQQHILVQIVIQVLVYMSCPFGNSHLGMFRPTAMWFCWSSPLALQKIAIQQLEASPCLVWLIPSRAGGPRRSYVQINK